jgi:hypothetical protein
VREGQLPCRRCAGIEIVRRLRVQPTRDVVRRNGIGLDAQRPWWFAVRPSVTGERNEATIGPSGQSAFG